MVSSQTDSTSLPLEVYPQPNASECHRGRPRSPNAVAMTATSGGTVAPVAMSPDVVVVGTDAGDQLTKPGRQEQFCSNATRPGGRRGLPTRPGRHRDETGVGGLLDPL